jgi:hypothetical protein
MPLGDSGVRVRFVAALRPGLLQSELITGERHFQRALPAEHGYRFFLLDAPPGREADISARLESSLSDFGFDVTEAAARLRAWSTPISSRPAMLVASRLRNSYVARSSLDLADRAVLRPLARLLLAVRKAAGDIPLLLVGATARDVLLVHAYGAEPQRSTEDTDVALAVPDWDTFLRVRDALVASGAFTRSTSGKFEAAPPAARNRRRGASRRRGARARRGRRRRGVGQVVHVRVRLTRR